jgi:phosphatidylserine decarboxylase
MKHQPVFLYNRHTEQIETEKVPGAGFLSLFYGKSWGRLVTDQVWSTAIFSRFYGLPFYGSWSRRFIDGFIQQNNIPMDEVQVPSGGFKSFNDFFIRRLIPGARPLPKDPSALIATADSRLKIFALNNLTVLDIKGTALTLQQLVGDTLVAEQFGGGICLQFRLAPRDYHRFGYIADGVQGPVHSVGGKLYSVSPLALTYRPSIWGQNYRQWCLIETHTLGTVLEIDIGATGVGSIVQHNPGGGLCCLGAEKGYFQLGGSTVLIIVQPGRIALDDDILACSNHGIEALVRYGERIGTCFPD